MATQKIHQYFLYFFNYKNILFLFILLQLSQFSPFALLCSATPPQLPQLVLTPLSVSIGHSWEVLFKCTLITTTVIIQSNKIVSKEVKDSYVLLEPSYGKNQRNFLASPVIMRQVVDANHHHALGGVFPEAGTDWCCFGASLFWA